MIKTLAVFLVVALAGCASAIMERYVGRLMSDAVMDYGMPTTAFDTDPGKRAFVWTRSTTMLFGGNTTTTATRVGNNIFASSYTAPTVASDYSCQYVAFAERIRTDIDGPAAWRITGFKKPRLMCE